MTCLLKRVFVITMISLFAIAAANAADFTGYFSIDSVSAKPGDDVSVPVYLHNNNVKFSSHSIPIRYNSSILAFDSVSFGGSILPNDFNGAASASADSGLIHLLYIPPFEVPTPTIDLSDGLIGTIWFSVSESATPGYLHLDTASYYYPYFLNGEWNEFWVGAMLSNSTGDTSWFPNCESGGIDVRIPTGVNDDLNNSLPVSFGLAQNYPNPFNPVTTISYSLEHPGHVKLEVFNVLGQTMSTLVDGIQPAGVHQVEFDGQKYPSGVYFYRLNQGESSSTKKMILVK
jgi:hypothetical protein